jgi:YidC/Oxa1 family membrane protein insertase
MDIIQILLVNTFGALLTFFYRLTNSYGVALILFTLITRAILFPLAIKQQRSTAEMARMRPKLDELQKKFAKDKTKLNEANMALYKEEGYNPAAGCLPMLVQLPIILGLYQVISNPLKNIYNLTNSQITEIAIKLHQLEPTKFIKFDPKNMGTYPETVLAPLMKIHSNVLNLPHNLTLMKFDFAGIDLTKAPGSFGMILSVYLLIPILCYLTQFLSSWLSIRMTAAANPQSAKSMNTTMIVFMPLLTTWFSLSVPASLGFYWVVSNLIMVIQVLILSKFYHPKKLAAISEQKSELKKQARLSSQISEIDNNSSSPIILDKQTENKQKNYQQNNLGLSNNQKKKNKYNNKKRLAASRENEKNNENNI